MNAADSATEAAHLREQIKDRDVRIQFLEQALLQCCSERDSAKAEAASFRECYEMAQTKLDELK